MKSETKNAAYADNPALLAAYRAGDRAAGEALAVRNRPLIYRLAERFRGRCADMSDLIECGDIGLVKAMNTFDLSRGVTFSTYAVPLILGEMRRFLRDDGTVKVSREEKKLCARLQAEKERRVAAGEDVSVGALAAAVGVTAADAAAVMFALSPVKSMDEPAYDDEGTTFGSTLCDEGEDERTFDRIALRMAVETLPEQERQLILLRYFRDMSQAEVANILGVTQVKVSREEKKILGKLRGLLE